MPGARLRDSLVVYSSDVTCAAIGFVSLILVSRTLGPEGYGVFSIAIALMGIAFQISDLGLSGGTTRFAAPLALGNRNKYLRTIRASLQLRAAASVAVFGGGFAASILLSSLLFGRNSEILVVILAFAGGLATSFFAHVRVVLQSERRFVSLATARVAVAVTTLVLLTVLITFKNLNDNSSVATYVIAPLSAFVIFSMFRRDRLAEKDLREERTGLLRFSKWIFVVAMLSAVFLKLDVFFLGATWTDRDVGLYSVAITLIYPVTQLANSLSTVLMPEVSSFKTKRALTRFMRGSFTYTVPISIALIVFALSPLPPDLIRLFFGSDYIEATDPFRVLSITGAAWLISTPLLLGVYPINRPKVLAQGDLIKLILHVVAYSILVAPFGIMGAAWGSALALGSGSVIAVALVFRAVRESEEIFPEESAIVR